MKNHCPIVLLLVAACFVYAATLGQAQTTRPTTHPSSREGQPAGVGAAGNPYTIFETKPTIVHGPYLVSPTERSVVVVWATDVPSTAKVFYGAAEPTREAASIKDGLLEVGTIHAVRVGGLEPGKSYRYRVESTPVVKIKGYWPDMGLPVQSPVFSFTTFDANKPTTSFGVVTDTHEDVGRIAALMKLIDWKSTDFLVQTGDAFNSLDTEQQLFAKWLEPISQALGSTKPLVFARGNHDVRGSFARELSRYVPIEESRFYYTRDDGPVHFLIVDTGEDKPDNTNVYAGLNAFAEYRKEQLSWFKEHTQSSKRMAEAPFRIVLMHQPEWGPRQEDLSAWTQWANDAKVDLIIAGHTHRFAHIPPGQRGNNYPILVVGQDQLARVEASDKQLKISVVAKDGSPVHSFVVDRRAAAEGRIR